MDLDQYTKAANRAGALAGGAAGVGGLANQWGSMVNSANMVNTNSPTQQFDAMGRPVYNLGQFAKTTNEIDPAKTGGGEIVAGGLQGLTTGAQIGSLGGPVGTLIGMGIGGLVGAGGTLIAGGIRRRKLDSKKRLAQSNLFAAQQLYNKSIASYNQFNTAQSRYNELSNTQNRIQNLYTFN